MNPPLEQRNLGKSRLCVSAIGLGCNNFGGRIDLQTTRRVVHKALDRHNLFDEADTYGDPRSVSLPALGGGRGQGEVGDSTYWLRFGHTVQASRKIAHFT